jgi:excisionase family DNA binding protein
VLSDDAPGSSDAGPISTAADGTVSLRDAAESIGVHYMTAYRYVRSGRLPAKKVGSTWRIDIADLQRLAAGEDPESLHVQRSGGSPRAAHRTRLESRLVAGDEAGAWGVLDAAMAAGADPDEVLLDLLSPSMASIGTRWADGEISIAEEHRASAVALRLIARLGPRFSRPGRKRGTVVLGSVAGDRHSLPTAMMADLLRGLGLEVVDLGADTPADSFVHAAHDADLLVAVAMCVTATGLDDSLAAAASAVKEAGIEAPVVVGGGAMTDRGRALDLGADAWAGDTRGALELFAELASGQRPSASA